MNMSNDVIVLLASAVVVLLSVGVMAVLWATYFSREKRERKTGITEQINKMQDKIFKFRSDHPEILSLGKQWNAENLEKVYRQSNDEDVRWAKYYTFVELCVAYCNTVLYAKNKNLIELLAFFQQYEPIVKLILTEHKQVIDDMVRDNKSVSDYFIKYRKSVQQ